MWIFRSYIWQSWNFAYCAAFEDCWKTDAEEEDYGYVKSISGLNYCVGMNKHFSPPLIEVILLDDRIYHVIVEFLHLIQADFWVWGSVPFNLRWIFKSSNWQLRLKWVLFPSRDRRQQRRDDHNNQSMSSPHKRRLIWGIIPILYPHSRWNLEIFLPQVLSACGDIDPWSTNQLISAFLSPWMKQHSSFIFVGSRTEVLDIQNFATREARIVICLRRYSLLL